jgi:hypothetical protein
MLKAGKRIYWTNRDAACSGGQCSGFVIITANDQSRVLWVDQCANHAPGAESTETVWNSDISDSPVMSEVA